MQVFSRQTLNVGVNPGLTGECDFILSKSEPTPILRESTMVVNNCLKDIQ